MGNKEKSMEDVLRNIQQFTKDGNVDINFNSRDRDEVFSAANLIKRDIEALMDGKEICPKEDDIRLVLRACSSILRCIIIEVADEHFKQFALSFSLLVYNWNTVVNDERIMNSVSAIQHLVDFHNTMISTAYMLKHLAREFEAMQHFNPPSYRVARGYLESLSERLECEKNEKKNND